MKRMNRRDYQFIIVLVLVVNMSGINSVDAQAVAPPEEDEAIYYGRGYGAAGIAETLLNVYQLDIVSEELQNELFNSATKALDELWDRRMIINDTQYALWPKVEGGEIYSSVKYGPIGIAKSFVRASSITGDSSYADYTGEILTDLFDIALNTTENLPNWGYAFPNIDYGALGISITDYNYGSLGFIDTILDLYEYEKDNTTFQLALDTFNWLNHSAITVEFENNSAKLLPWYVDEYSSNRHIITGLGTGNAAAIPVFNRLADLSNNSYFSDWALNLTKWYQFNQTDDGYWRYNADIENSAVYTSFNIGVSGILHTLIQSDLSIENLNTSIQTGYDWLLSKIVSNDTHYYLPEEVNHNYGKFNLNQGLMGFIRFLRQYSEIRSDQSVVDLFETSLISLLDKGTMTLNQSDYKVRVLYPRTNINSYTDLSLSEGIAGIIDELIQIYSSDLKDKINLGEYDLLDIIEEFSWFLILNQMDDGLWPKQVDISEYLEQPGLSSYLIYIFAILFFVLLIGYKVKKS